MQAARFQQALGLPQVRRPPVPPPQAEPCPPLSSSAAALQWPGSLERGGRWVLTGKEGFGATCNGLDVEFLRGTNQCL